MMRPQSTYCGLPEAETCTDIDRIGAEGRGTVLANAGVA